MTVEISVLKQNCEHLEKISHYNDNYYKLPFTVNGCSILHESYDSAETFCGNTIGNLVDGKYVPQAFLHCLEKDNAFLINSSCMGKRNEWT